MTIPEFIQAAKDGGWREGQDIRLDPKYGLIRSWSTKEDAGKIGHGMDLLDWTELYLDPKAWEAVGKVRGWKESDDWQYKAFSKVHPDGSVTYEKRMVINHYQIAMHEMVNALCEGRTISEYIATL